jgi:hypothetical protein
MLFKSYSMLLLPGLWWMTSLVGRADVITFLNQSEYLTAISTLNFAAVHEGFESNSTWGSLRSTISGGPQTAQSVTSHGVTWTSNNSFSEVTTSSGAARTGNWGFYSLPHGYFGSPNHAADVPDGFVGTSTEVLYGVGGWIRTNTPVAGISLSLDFVQVDFGDLPGGGDPTALGTTYKFFGAIDTAGFRSFRWQETEGTFEDQKLIFADDFRYAVSVSAVPEPSTLALLGSAFCLILARRSRPTNSKRQRHATTV